ncbi:MAG: glycosyltransferase family 9 protein [Kiritimatiellaeota bacterium]|nr:glycosyltransferase family 9 protein [Kiritimatiellota bacterium]
MSSAPKQVRILVLRGGAIGDFILTLPALQKLRARWPTAYIELVGYPHIADLALAGGLVERVVSLDKAEMARFFARGTRFTGAQREHVQSFDLVVSYLHDPDDVVRQNLLMAGARQVIYGSPLLRAGHAIEQFLQPLETLALYAEGAERPQLALRAELRQRGRDGLAARGLRGPVLAVHPGSGSPHKNWPADRFIALIRALRDDLAPLLVLGEADQPLAPVLARELPDVAVLTGCALVEVAAVLAACRAYVGNDSGITHLAAALGLPVVALFGPTDPEAWGPRGPAVRIVQAPDGRLEEVPLVAVLDAVRALPVLA